MDTLPKKIYQKYIDREIYRVVSSEYIPEIEKHGLNPTNNPYQKVIPDIKHLFKVVVRLEKHGWVHEQDWGFKIVPGSYIAMVSLEDMVAGYIDFTPDFRETKYYKKHNGGALVQTVLRMTDDILQRKPIISNQETALVKRLYKWAQKKSEYKNVTIVVKGSSKYLEHALFQHRLGKKGKDKYWKSPFGRPEHFRQIVEEEGYDKYEPFVLGKQRFYLRTFKKIPSKEIKILG